MCFKEVLLERIKSAETCGHCIFHFLCFVRTDAKLSKFIYRSNVNYTEVTIVGILSLTLQYQDHLRLPKVSPTR